MGSAQSARSRTTPRDCGVETATTSPAPSRRSRVRCRRHSPAPDIVVDGEVVAFDTKGRPDFELLQSRLGLTSARSVERAAERVPAHLIAFDVLRLDGHDTSRLSYRQRREACSIPQPSRTARYRFRLPSRRPRRGYVQQSRTRPRRNRCQAPGQSLPGRPSVAGLDQDQALPNAGGHCCRVAGGDRPALGRRRVSPPGGQAERGGATPGKVGTGFSDQDLTDMTAKAQTNGTQVATSRGCAAPRHPKRPLGDTAARG